MKPSPSPKKAKIAPFPKYAGEYSLVRRRKKLILLWILTWGGIAALALFGSGAFTIGGIPSSLAFKFLRDPEAILWAITGRKQQLHDRLENLGFEEDIKAYYRPQIPDERELDRYIHQLLFNWTGYVGKEYKLLGNGVLVRKR